MIKFTTSTNQNKLSPLKLAGIVLEYIQSILFTSERSKKSGTKIFSHSLNQTQN